MKTVVAIGELLIDFIPDTKGVSLKDVGLFMRKPGGAPANVAVAARRSGAPSALITMVGDDAFGIYLKETVASFGVDVESVRTTGKANTALAFVTLDSHGDRDFVFYRNPSADQLMEPEDTDPNRFGDAILHFCSVSLGPYPMRKTHEKVIRHFRENGMLVSFDPNVRLPLFSDHDAYRDTIGEFLEVADLVKVSEDELGFITREKTYDRQVQALFKGSVRFVIVTKGASGSVFHTRTRMVEHPGFKVEVKDTTGAGDAFIGAFLSKIAKNGLDETTPDADIVDMLAFSNAAAALTTTRFGAMDGIPSEEETNAFLKVFGATDFRAF
jgi:fructokinase